MSINVKHLSSFNELYLTLKAVYLFSPLNFFQVLSYMILQAATAGIGLMLLVPLLDVIGITHNGTPGNINQLVGSIFENLNIPLSLINILILYVVIISLIATIRYQLLVSIAKLQHSYISYLRNDFYQKLLKTRWQFIVRQKLSDFNSALIGQIQTIGNVANLLLNLMSQLCLFVLMGIIMMIFSWQLSFIALLIMMLLGLTSRPLNARVYHSGKKQLNAFKRIFQLLSEQLKNLKIIKIFCNENFHANQVYQASVELEKQQIILAKINALTQWIYMVFAVVLFSLILYISLVLLEISVASSIVLIIIFSRLIPHMTAIYKTYQKLIHHVPTLQNIRILEAQFINEKESTIVNHRCYEGEEVGLQQNDDVDIKALEFNHSIELCQISWQYNENQSVIKDLSLTLNKGEMLLINGLSGSGKSTLADIFSGLLYPLQGKIKIDGCPLLVSQLALWRKKIAYVTQDVLLFHATIRENLLWGCNTTISENKISSVLHLAAATFVEHLPQGLDTVIGDNGGLLSGGERQRLALARALLHEPELLILDEITSHLDNKNTEQVISTIKQLVGKFTIVLISHEQKVMRSMVNVASIKINL
ncbi:ABC transporter ATP-binding protein [Aliikangiella maris]|uniref:ABC transporter ATP-binding protein n=2 Tax=Aliikangiella maris TaxID=3162458 RepID=A0ABV3MN74_9GAMM